MLLIILVLSPVTIFILHIALSRLWSRQPRQTVALLSALGGAAPMGALLYWLVLRALPAPRGAAFYSAVVYGAIAYSYFHLFNMSETARRLRILNEIENAGSLTKKEINALYDLKKNSEYAARTINRNPPAHFNK